MTNSNLDKQDELDDFLESITQAWCDYCDHPRCTNNRATAKRKLLALIQEAKDEVFAQAFAGGYKQGQLERGQE